MQGPSREWLLKMAELEDGKSTSVGGLLCDLGLYKRPHHKFSAGDTIRMPHYATAGGFRVWMIEAVYYGAENQEGTYHLKSLDINASDREIQVPCIILETHPEIEIV